MIKENELRIGSVINYTTDEGDILPSVMDWQDIKWIQEDAKGFNLVHSPIDLTEEILLKCGFSKDGYKNGFLGKDFKSGNIIIDFVLCEPFKKGEFNKFYSHDLEGYKYVEIQYLHQLQNLYFALTGEELEYGSNK